MKETTDPKTGAKELQPEEYVPTGPVQIAKPKSVPPRNPLDVLHEKIGVLESQIRSLQMAVAALERKIDPLKQA
jgi:hypothetical protein